MLAGRVDASWTASFIISSFGLMSLFKGLETAHAAYPKGADVSLGTWVSYYLATPETKFEDGKMVPAPPGTLGARTKSLLGKFAGYALLGSFLTHFPRNEPFDDSAVYGRTLNYYLLEWMVYFFLAILLDIGALITLAGGNLPEEAFRSPLWLSSNFTDTWGRRWNLVIHRNLKRTVHKPLRSIGASARLGAFCTFVASGLVHEYTFSIHNRAAWVPGHACIFFTIMAGLMIVEGPFHDVLPAPIQAAWAATPAQVRSVGLGLISAYPFGYYFLPGWISTGFLESSLKVVPTITCS